MPRVYREVWTCSLLSGAEVAQFGWWWLDPASSPADLISAINAENNDLWEAWRPSFPSQTVWQGSTLDEYDISTGAKIGVNALGGPTNPAGSCSSRPLPPQCSIVLSWRGAGLSARARGRAYLPGPCVDAITTTTGRLQPGNQEDIADAFLAYINAVGAAATGVQAGTYSHTDHAFTGLVNISIGDVIDTQRRRRDALPESRYSIP